MRLLRTTLLVVFKEQRLTSALAGKMHGKFLVLFFQYFGCLACLWMPNGNCIGRCVTLLEKGRTSWSRQASAGDHYDIFEIGAVGPAPILHNGLQECLCLVPVRRGSERR